MRSFVKSELCFSSTAIGRQGIEEVFITASPSVFTVISSSQVSPWCFPPSQENLLFAFIISAVDPVAALNIFDDVGVNEQIYIVIFSEGLFNDTVTVVSLNSSRRMRRGRNKKKRRRRRRKRRGPGKD